RVPNHRAMRAESHSSAGETFPVLFGRENDERLASGAPESAYKKSGRALLPRAARKPQNSANVGRYCWRDCALFKEQLLAQTKAFDNLAIPIRVTTVEIIQKTAALVDHH